MGIFSKNSEKRKDFVTETMKKTNSNTNQNYTEKEA